MSPKKRGKNTLHSTSDDSRDSAPLFRDKPHNESSTISPLDPSNFGQRVHGATSINLPTRPGAASLSSGYFFPVKRKDTRDHLGFENDHVLNFASRVVFGDMFTGKNKMKG